MNILHVWYTKDQVLFCRTAVVALRLERPPRKREVVGSIPASDKPKSLKLVEVASPLALRTAGIALRLAHQCQDNELVQYRLKIVQETWICELLPLTN